MTTSPDAPSGRFRQAELVATTPEEQLAQLLGDGARMYARYEELLRTAGSEGDVDAVVRLAKVAQRAVDPHRAYASLRLATGLLLAMADAQRRGGAGSGAATAPLVAAVQLLVPALEGSPHEPELLLQLAQVLRGLGDHDLARRAGETVLSLEPEHQAARAFADAASSHRPGAARSSSPHTAFASRIEDVLDRAALLDDRTISLCMIVRDEEEMLGECLASVAPFVDQLVVVDTGSVDRTIDIAREYGATVVEFPWNGSFSDARNESLRHATGDWILWLDADERLVTEDGPRLRELARRTWVEGFHVLETHFLGSGDDGTSMHAPMRMFRRRPDYVWHGRVHEQVASTLPSWLPGRVQHTTIRVDHYGYLADVVRDRDKGRRNLDLLLMQHREDPSAFTSFNIASEYAAAGDWSDAHSWFERALDEVRAQAGDWRSQPWTPLLVQRAATARRLAGDVDGTLALAGEGLEAWPDYTDLEFERARACFDRGDWDAAEEHARAALALGDAPARYVAVTGRGSFQARHLLAGVRRARGDVDGARRELVAALELAPHFHVALDELAELLLTAERTPDEVDATVDDVLGERAGAVAANMTVGSRMHEAGHLDHADARYGRVLAVNPNHGPALVARADLLLARHEFERAWELGMQVDEFDRLAPAGAQSAFLAAAALDRADLVAAPAERIERATELGAPERAVYVAWRQLLDPGSGVHPLVPASAGARETVLRNLHALARVHATDAFERLHALVDVVLPDPYERGLRMSELYLRLSFADMAGAELMDLAERFGPDAPILTGLGKVATIKQLWEDAEVLLGESLQLDPSQSDARRLLEAVQERRRA